MWKIESNFMDATSARLPDQGQPFSAPYLASDAWPRSEALAIDSSSGNATEANSRGLAGQRTDPPRSEARSGSGPDGPTVLILGHKAPATAEVENQQALRLKSLQARKSWAERFAKWLDLQGHRDHASKLNRCGTFLLFHYLLGGPEAGSYRLAGTNYCSQTRLCPFCSHWRAVKVLRTYGQRIFNAVCSGYIPYLATWTLRNGPDLRECLTTYRQAQDRIAKRRRRARSGGHRHSSAYRLVGGQLSQIEIKRGSGSGQWHPHGHAVLLCEDRLDVEACQDEWSGVLGYEAQSNFKPLRSYLERDAGLTTRQEFETNLFKDLCEVVKYQCKFGDGENGSLAYSDVWDAFRVLKPRERLLSSVGVLRGGAYECEKEFVEPIEDEWPYLERLYRWVDGEYEMEVKHGYHVEGRMESSQAT